MYRRCVVTEVDPATHRVRGTFPDRDELVSPWLEVLARGAHAFKDFGLPHVGDQVAVLLDEREEAGCVLGALFSQADPVPSGATATKRVLAFADGARISYDDEAHVLEVSLPEGATLRLAGNAEPIALADKVASELAAIQSALDSHTHQAGMLAAPSGGGPVTGTTGTASAGYSPNEVGAAQVRSA